MIDKDNIKDNAKKLSKPGLFAAGALFATAGIKVLTSPEAKNVYTKCTAAVLRAKDCVMQTVSKVQENAEDIYAEAQMINELRDDFEDDFFDIDITDKEEPEFEIEFFTEEDEAEEADAE